MSLSFYLRKIKLIFDFFFDIVSPVVAISNDNDANKLRCFTKAGYPPPGIVLQKLEKCSSSDSSKCTDNWLNVSSAVAKVSLVCFVLSFGLVFFLLFAT